jgi:hypothetical protein
MTIDLERICREEAFRIEEPPERLSYARFVNGKLEYAIERQALARLVNAVLEEAAKAVEPAPLPLGHTRGEVFTVMVSGTGGICGSTVSPTAAETIRALRVPENE